MSYAWLIRWDRAGDGVPTVYKLVLFRENIARFGGGEVVFLSLEFNNQWNTIASRYTNKSA